MHIIVLGSAAGGGHPQWNCRTPASLRAWQQQPGAQRRTQASIAVSADKTHWLLVNASPDFRQQVLAAPALWPRQGLRHTPIDAVLLTSGEIDHVAGLLSMRESQRVDLYASARVLEVLAQNPIFDALDPQYVPRHALALETPMQLAGLRVTAFAVPGKVPLFMESRSHGDLAGSEGETLGLCIEHDGHRMFYVPGCAAMNDGLRQRLSGAELVFFDGTLWRDDELIQTGVGHKTGQRMGHLSVDGPGGTVAELAPLGIRRKIFIHINTTNPILDPHSGPSAMVAAHGWEVAFDGMDIQL